MAQGSKPGEGGQLPGHKVSRGDRPPAPHPAGRRAHLAAAAPRHLLHRGPGPAHLRPQAGQRRAEVSVKLVAEDGVGTIAAGVVKALADVVHISGANGGTGASPAVVDQERRHALGARPGRGAAGPGRQRPAQPGAPARRRRVQDRPPRGGRRAARGRRVLLRHGGDDRRGLHHVAGLPPRHLQARGGHPADRTCGPTSPARPKGWRPTSCSWPRRSVGCWPGWALAPSTRPIGRVDLLTPAPHGRPAGRRLRPLPAARAPAPQGRAAPVRRAGRDPEPTLRARRPAPGRRLPAGVGRRRDRPAVPDHQRRPAGRRGPVGRGRPRVRRPCRRGHGLGALRRARPARASARSSPTASSSSWWARPTTTWARAWPGAASSSDRRPTTRPWPRSTSPGPRRSDRRVRASSTVLAGNTCLYGATGGRAARRRSRRRALRRAQLGRAGRAGGRGRPLLRVHDRRHRGRARSHRLPTSAPA